MYLFERGKEPGEKPEVTESPQGNQGDNNMGERTEVRGLQLGAGGTAIKYLLRCQWILLSVTNKPISRQIVSYRALDI